MLYSCTECGAVLDDLYTDTMHTDNPCPSCGSGYNQWVRTADHNGNLL